MKRLIVMALWMIAAVPLIVGQVGTTTGGPLTVTGIPIYGIADNGDLYWYFHQGARTGSATWANGGRRVKVGNAWNQGLRVFRGSPNGDDGIIYRVASNGDLYWYKHAGNHTGSQNWVGPKRVGYGWQGARMVFAAGDGIIYAIDNGGALTWYRHMGYADGSEAWANGASGISVGTGWENMRLVFSGGVGVIYAIDRRGDLYWYRHDGYTNGSFAWANGAKGIKIGSGWNDVVSAFSGGSGVIYAMKRDGNLYWYHHTGDWNGAATWTSPTGKLVGSGWEEMVRIF